MDETERGMWRHLPVLVRANSKESVEYILEALWRTRRTGLDDADRKIFRDILQLPSGDSQLDPLLVCLRVLIRRCVYEPEHDDKLEIHKLFPHHVPPELQRLLTLLLQKFQNEWRQDASKDDEQQRLLLRPNSDKRDVQFQLAKDTMEMMLESMY